jgi:hypothetical protein
MGKDSKGHGSDTKVIHQHRGFVATQTPKGIEIVAPNGRLAATHDKERGVKEAMKNMASGYHRAAKQMAARGETPNYGISGIRATTTNRKY